MNVDFLLSPRIPCVNGYGVMLSHCVSKKCYGGRSKEKRRSIDAPELPGGRTDGTCGLLVSPPVTV